MKSKGLVISVVAATLLFVVIVGLSLAQNNNSQDTTSVGPMRIEATLGTMFSFQGRLMDNGRPANGTYDFRFRLYDAQNGGHSVGALVYRNNIPVRNGLFSVTLDFGTVAFTGDARWLQVEVRPGTSGGAYTVLTPRQPIYAVPYALSLRPGATVADSESSAQLNKRFVLPFPVNLIWKYGVYGTAGGSAANTTYIGVYGSSSSANGYGGWFSNTASGGVALYARAHDDADPDLVLGGTGSTNDNGVLSSDPRYPSSDIVIKTNDTVRIDLDSDKSGEDADFEIRDKDGHLIFDVDESGAVISALPRPAYDSGWQSISQGELKTFTHNLGGDVDNYVVDMTCKSHNASYGINQLYFGGDGHDSKTYGAYWRHLTTTSITVRRMPDDAHCDQVRIRIWVYK